MAVDSGSATAPGMKAACGDFDASIEFSRAMNDWEQQFDIVIRELNHMIEVMGGEANAWSANA